MAPPADPERMQSVGQGASSTSIRPTPLAYRVQGLVALPAHEQHDLVTQAVARSKSSLGTRLAVGSWVALCLLTLFFLRSAPMLQVALVALVGMSGTASIMCLSVRVSLRQFLRQRPAARRS